MTVDPILTNPARTVGLCSGYIRKSDFIGKFRPGELKEWAEWIIEHFGTDQQVYVSLSESKNEDNTAKMLSACPEYGEPDEMYICVVGCDNADVIEKTVVKTANKTIEKKTKIKDVKKT